VSRKRSKYRPKAQFANPLAAVLERLTPVRQHESYLVDLKIKNHGAVASVMRGTGTREDINLLMAMSNMVEALLRLGFGTEYEAIQQAGFDAVRDIAERFQATGRATLYASEIEKLNDYLDLHDAQMEVITVQDVDRALVQIKKDAAAGRTHRLHPAALTV
jgi:hypothetical protein